MARYTQEQLIEILDEYGLNGSSVKETAFYKNNGFIKAVGNTHNSFMKKLESLFVSVEYLGKKKEQPPMYEIGELRNKPQEIEDKRKNNGKERHPLDYKIGELFLTMLYDEVVFSRKGHIKSDSVYGWVKSIGYPKGMSDSITEMQYKKLTEYMSNFDARCVVNGYNNDMYNHAKSNVLSMFKLLYNLGVIDYRKEEVPLVGVNEFAPSGSYTQETAEIIKKERKNARETWDLNGVHFFFPKTEKHKRDKEYAHQQIQKKTGYYDVRTVYTIELLEDIQIDKRNKKRFFSLYFKKVLFLIEQQHEKNRKKIIENAKKSRSITKFFYKYHMHYLLLCNFDEKELEKLAEEAQVLYDNFETELPAFFTKTEQQEQMDNVRTTGTKNIGFGGENYTIEAHLNFYEKYKYYHYNFYIDCGSIDERSNLGNFVINQTSHSDKSIDDNLPF